MDFPLAKHRPGSVTSRQHSPNHHSEALKTPNSGFESKRFKYNPSLNGLTRACKGGLLKIITTEVIEWQTF